ncbi:follistatin-related protein 3 isoform X2 [Ranitomeya variabilis]|uniref:follistatin-related protein 3 isoform X2 n=1 Tax=Ranitomeya variabilis TaxID=490064 RepID=UPI0040566CB5
MLQLLLLPLLLLTGTRCHPIPGGDTMPPGGTCWLLQSSSSTCSLMLLTAVTWDECCSDGHLDTAWSNYTDPMNKISLLGFLGLVNCQPCRDSCDDVQCPPDGNTYQDECELITNKCRGQPDLEVMYSGKCKKSCSNVVCPGTHSCVVDQTGSAHCVMCRISPCPMPFASDYNLCGNNNVTYPSACHLRRATCFLGRSIGVRHAGSCAVQSNFSMDLDDAVKNFV